MNNGMVFLPFPSRQLGVGFLWISHKRCTVHWSLSALSSNRRGCQPCVGVFLVIDNSPSFCFPSGIPAGTRMNSMPLERMILTGTVSAVANSLSLRLQCVGVLPFSANLSSLLRMPSSNSLRARSSACCLANTSERARSPTTSIPLLARRFTLCKTNRKRFFVLAQEVTLEDSQASWWLAIFQS